VARVIAVTGIDGSGKTTSARNLQVSLENAGFTAEYKHQFDSVLARGLSRLRRLLPAKASEPLAIVHGEAAYDSRLRKPALLKKFAAYFYLLLQAIGANRARFAKPDFLVFDRYFYDDFVRFRQRYGIAERYFYFVEMLVPRPDLIVTLNGDVQKTYERQVDIDSSYETYLEKLDIHQSTMQKLVQLGFRTVEIDTTKSTPTDVLSEVMRALKENMVV